MNCLKPTNYNLIYVPDDVPDDGRGSRLLGLRGDTPGGAHEEQTGFGYHPFARTHVSHGYLERESGDVLIGNISISSG